MSSKVSSTLGRLPSFSSLVGNAFREYRQDARMLFGYAGWMLLPLAAEMLFRLTMNGTVLGETLSAVSLAVFVVLAMWAANAVSLSVAKHKGDIGQEAARWLLPSFLVALLVFLLTVGGLILFIIPGLLFATWFALAPTTLILEHTTVVGALQRSKHLVHGRFWGAFGRLWGFDLLIVVLYGILVFALGTLFGSTEWITTQGAPLPLGLDIILTVIEIAIFPLVVTYRTLLYLALKNG